MLHTQLEWHMARWLSGEKEKEREKDLAWPMIQVYTGTDNNKCRQWQRGEWYDKSVQKGQRKEVKSPCCKINMINHNLKMKQRGIRL